MVQLTQILSRVKIVKKKKCDTKFNINYHSKIFASNHFYNLKQENLKSIILTSFVALELNFYSLVRITPTIFMTYVMNND